MSNILETIYEAKYETMYDEECQKTASLLRQLKEQRCRLRDEFAMAALTGLLAYSYVNPMRGNYHENCDDRRAAESAYEYADAMLKAREITP